MCRLPRANPVFFDMVSRTLFVPNFALKSAGMGIQNWVFAWNVLQKLTVGINPFLGISGLDFVFFGRLREQFL